MKNCFSDEDMFFGGNRYKYVFGKHKQYITNKERLERYKDYDGLIFDYNLEFQDDRCRIDLPNGDFIRMSREWCDKVDK